MAEGVDGRAIGQSVALYPLDEAIVRRVQAVEFSTSVSDAVRFVLREFAKARGWVLEELLREGEQARAGGDGWGRGEVKREWHDAEARMERMIG